MLRGRVAFIVAIGAAFVSGCSSVAWDDQDAGAASGMSSGGTSSGGASASSTGSGAGAGAGPAACPTGAHFTSFGATSGATIGVASDETGLSWANDDGSVWKAAPGGGSPHPIAQHVGEGLYTVATDHGDVYVVDYAAGLWRVGADAGAPTMLAQGEIGAVAVDAAAVYFTDLTGVRRVGKGGGPAVLLASVEDADSIALDDAWVYVKTIGNTGDLTATIVRVPKAGGAPEVVAQSGIEAYHYFSQELGVDAENVYWVAPSQGTVMSAPKAGGGAPAALASGIADPVSLTVDGANVYFTVRGKDGGSDDDRAVGRVPSAGGDVTFVAHGPDVSAFGIAVDATHAYWTAKAIEGPVSTACK